MHAETRVRSLAKTVSWRITGTLVTAVLVFAVTGQIKLALAIGGLEAAAKLIVYFAHERLWNRVNFGRTNVKPAVIWFTGLSGSGKSTIANEVASRLERMGFKTERLDGDLLRQIFTHTGFSRGDREDHVRRAAFLASRLEKHGIFVVASLITPYETSRNEIRKLCDNYIEIHVATPLEVCEKRDPKGYYAKARRGEIKNFTGVDDPYETPKNPDLVIDTSHLTVAESADLVLNAVQKRV